MSDLQSVRRALHVLDALQDVPTLGVSELASWLDVSSSTAHRLLATMEREGYVRHITGSRRYELGSSMQATRFGAEIDECVDIARPYMFLLRDLSQETAHIAMLSGTWTRFLAAAESPRIMRVTSRVGQRLPAHRTAAGKLLLSHLPPHEVELLYRRAGAEAHDPLDFRALFAELAVTREREFGVNHGESEIGVAALAVPLRLSGGRVICSLTLTGPTTRIHPGEGASLSGREHELLAYLRRTAAEIEAELPGS